MEPCTRVLQADHSADGLGHSPEAFELWPVLQPEGVLRGTCSAVLLSKRVRTVCVAQRLTAGWLRRICDLSGRTVQNSTARSHPLARSVPEVRAPSSRPGLAQASPTRPGLGGLLLALQPQSMSQPVVSLTRGPKSSMVSQANLAAGGSQNPRYIQGYTLQHVLQ